MGIGGSALSLDMDREGPAPELRDPGCGDSAPPPPSTDVSSMLVDS